MMALAWLMSYLVGSFPTAYVLARVVKGIDIRTVGSGNVGATNAARAVGPWGGIVVLVADVLKGVLAVALIPRIMPAVPSTAMALSCGLAAVLGHDFPVWLRARGGKGVATTIGVVGAGDPVVALTMVGVWAVVCGGCRYVSIASLAAAMAIPLSQLAWHRPSPEVMVGAALALLIVAQHRANIQRLLAGAEPRGFSRVKG